MNNHGVVPLFALVAIAGAILTAFNVGRQVGQKAEFSEKGCKQVVRTGDGSIVVESGQRIKLGE